MEILLADTLEKQVFGVGVVEWALVAFQRFWMVGYPFLYRDRQPPKVHEWIAQTTKTKNTQIESKQLCEKNGMSYQYLINFFSFS